ncbi:MAG: hypothetical protein JWR01_1570 [Subtercola sp.]|nr:hypothetical protein [Subtercola sp.]
MLLTGCAAPLGNACSAVGWLNTVEVQLEGSASALDLVAWVEFCDADSCSRSDQQNGIAPTPTGEALSEYRASPSGPTGWSVEVGMSQPPDATVTAYAADASVLATTTAVLEWRRVGGSERCGGPGAADAVHLQLGD